MDYIYKIILIGDISVGKTNLFSRFTTNDFSHELKSTIGVDFAMKKITLNNKLIEAQIWDCAGQERYRSISKFYFRGANGIILVYDITKRESFLHIKDWLTEIKDHTATILLVGNKSDLDFKREVTTEDGTQFARDHGLLFLETSALNGFHVNDAFLSIITEIFNQTKHTVHSQNERPLPSSSTVTVVKEPIKQCYC
jgi:small GTP-binding protein